MKNSTTGGNGDSNAFKRQTIGSLLLSDEEDICFSSGGNADSNAQRRLTIGSLLMSDEEDNCFIFDDSSPEAGPVGLDRPTPPPPSRTSFYHTPTPSSNLSTTSSESDQYSSPESKCQWPAVESNSDARLMGAIVKREGHIHSIATAGDLLYTGSESKTIRVWKNQKEFTGFKSGSGLVKAIAVAGERIFSGHQDGTIRIWKASTKDPTIHKRVGTLPTFRAQIKNSLNPSNYIEIKKHRNAVWIKHTDAISCLTFSDDKSLLFSASWDKTFKIWRISDSKCLESINAHADGVNSIAAAAGGLIFTGSADGTLRAWLRQKKGKGTKHFQILLEQDFAVTAVAVNASSKYLYSGSSDGVVNFWEIDKCLRHGGTLKGHSLAVLCLTTADNLVFSGSADTSICVWRSVGGVHTCHSVLRGHGGPVKCLAVEEEKGGGDKQFIVYSGSIDKSVKIWKVPAAQPPAEVLTETSPPHGIFDIRV